jgi:hypothetical protein
VLAPRRTTRAALGALIVSLSELVACGGPPRVTDYGPEAEDNFVGSCTKDRTIEDGKQVITNLATTSFCTCVYRGIRDTYKLSWDQLSEYDKQVADAEPGELPKPPSQLTKAMEACNTAGPAAPSDTAEDETTTTEG